MWHWNVILIRIEVFATECISSAQEWKKIVVTHQTSAVLGIVDAVWKQENCILYAVRRRPNKVEDEWLQLWIFALGSCLAVGIL